ncbi:MAG: GNAT family N-acetyltransferase [Chloroflexi bacterium]|nr:GNAT family N-acetyltransferase [Chloroflexota bacterium]MCC6892698.1 GNAT family N-acetyltransferase [Anaerolineae bacterium]
MLTPTTPYTRHLENGLILKSVRDKADAERLALFNGQIFGEGVTGMTRSLIYNHPHTRLEHWLYIEDEATGQIISALSLIPWLWRCEDVLLKSGEMGVVGTLPEYRKRGLIRTLVTRHRELLREGDYDLSNIQGNPYFYRQFGYEYAIPLEANYHLERHNLPDAPGEAAAAFQVRRATPSDIPALMELYDEAAKQLDISAVRDAATWQYQLEGVKGDTESEFWLVIDAQGVTVGYWRIAFHGFGAGLIVCESSRLTVPVAEAVVVKLKALAVERGKPDIRLNLPANSDLIQLGKIWHVHHEGAYAWQIQIVDVARLLRKIAPVLERRIAASPFSGLDEHVIINLYREAFDLHFSHGKLVSVTALGFSERGEINIPPLLLAPLLLGYRSREELSHMYPDVSCWPRAKVLVDVLFPKMESFIYSGY